MRTPEEWKKYESQYYKYFPPRVQRDMVSLKLVEPTRIEGSVFIHGRVCTGKTVLAAQLMMVELKHIYLNSIPDVHNTVRFVSFPDLLEEIKNSYNPKPVQTTQEVMKKYMDSYFLVIDDFMNVKVTDWVWDTVYHLINHRYDYLLTTVLTSNYSLQEIEKIVQDQRITSRIDRSYTVIEKMPFKK